MGRVRSRARWWLAAACFLAACAPKQKIPLDCIPKEVVVYVDGERLDELPPELDLRSDEPHTIYWKGPGIESELIVLISEEVGGRSKLSPTSVCLHPRLIEVRRELEFAIDPDVSAAPPEGTRETGSITDVSPPAEFLPETL